MRLFTVLHTLSNFAVCTYVCYVWHWISINQSINHNELSLLSKAVWTGVGRVGRGPPALRRARRFRPDNPTVHDAARTWLLVAVLRGSCCTAGFAPGTPFATVSSIVSAPSVVWDTRHHATDISDATACAIRRCDVRLCNAIAFSRWPIVCKYDVARKSIQNASQRHQTRTEPGNVQQMLVKIWRVVSEICSPTGTRVCRLSDTLKSSQYSANEIGFWLRQVGEQ